jgi:3-dehydroquinate dehydratase-2
MKKIVVLHGPNLDRLGQREPAIYGHATLADLERELRAAFPPPAAELEFLQSNHEGVLVDTINALANAGRCHGIVLNAGALTHTSIALRDALNGSGIPAVEVHLSNVHAREEFRHRSYTAGVCLAVIAGLGFAGYHAAIKFLLERSVR